jgi:hypothetical protein
MKRFFLLFIIIFTLLPLISLAQSNPVNEATPVVTPALGPYTGNCKPTDKDCYVFLEALPTSTGDLTSIDTTAKGTDKGIGGFITFAFEIGVGVAGILGVVMQLMTRI